MIQDMLLFAFISYDIYASNVKGPQDCGNNFKRASAARWWCVDCGGWIQLATMRSENANLPTR